MDKRKKDSSSLQVEELVPLEFFDGYSPAEIRELLPYIEESAYAPGSPIVEEDISRKGIQLILEGEVRVVKSVSEEHAVQLATLRRGDIFGEASMFDDGPHTSRVEAVEPTRTLAITQTTYRRMRKEAPHLAEKIAGHAASVLSKRLRQANEAVLTYAVWSRSLQQQLPPSYWRWFPLGTGDSLMTRDLDEADK
jgi:CRP-like cAMP-binding protein